jgi:predicted regulator of Ras-like GTPase activity (Roadblock/LC7/MglB family)
VTTRTRGSRAKPAAPPAEELSVEEPPVGARVLAELRGLRTGIPGVHGSLVVTSDGLLITHDCLDDEGTEQTGALSSTLLALARHAVDLNACGSLIDAAVRGSDGYFVVYAIGEAAVLAVHGDADLNLAMLHIKTRPVVQRLTAMTQGFARFFGS